MWSLNIYIVLAFLWCLVVNSTGQYSKKFFRDDYTYIESTESFYKIHTKYRTWYEAKKICAAEGAHFFYPEDGNEAERVLEFLNASQNYNTYHKRIYDYLRDTIYGTIAFPLQVNPFICKKSLATLVWNRKCSMPDIDYKFNQNLERCYKFHQNRMTWSDAYAVCHAEQSYLAVIDSQEEADHLMTLVNTTKAKQPGTGSYTNGAIHVGFHNKINESRITRKGVPLVDSGYYTRKWATGKPSGNGKELCGAMLYDGNLSNMGCDQRRFFICEHDVEVTMDVDVRFGDDSSQNEGNYIL